jgi:hypothetical protein
MKDALFFRYRPRHRRQTMKVCRAVECDGLNGFALFPCACSSLLFSILRLLCVIKLLRQGGLQSASEMSRGGDIK